MAEPFIVGVMGPGEGATSEDIKNAFQVGRGVARNGWFVLTGGRSSGVMHAALKGAKQENGTTLGILPGDDYRGMSPYVDIPILTGLGEARNVINILTSHFIVACGVGPGTSSEISLAIKKQKPVVLLGTDKITSDFYSRLDENLLIAATPTDVLTIISQWYS